MPSSAVRLSCDFSLFPYTTLFRSSGFIRTMLLGESSWSGSAIDLRLMAFTAVAAIGTGLLTSLLPAMQASRPDLTSALKAGAREGGAARSRTRSVLLAGQAALAIILLAGAGLFVRSLKNVTATPLGVDIRSEERR